MPLYINHATVTVDRDGRRLKIKPSGAPFEFTEAEAAQAIAAGAVMESQGAPKVAKVIGAPAPEPKTEPASKPAKGKAKKAEPTDDEDDGDL